jgi:HEAT repeat protein
MGIGKFFKSVRQESAYVFQDVKTACLTVTQSFGESGLKVLRFPISDIVEELLTNRGIKVYKAPSSECDIVLTVRVRGVPISRVYTAGSRSWSLYLGASISGEVELSGKDHAPIKRSFSGRIDPPAEFRTQYSSPLEQSPQSAPLERAFPKADFVKELLFVLTDAFGMEILLDVNRLPYDVRCDLNINSQEKLEQFLKGIDPHWRDKAGKHLLEILQDPKSNRRDKAAEELGILGDKRAVKPLITALVDEEKKIRHTAAEALDKLGWTPDKTGDCAAYWVEKKEWSKCSVYGTFAIKPLLLALRDGDEETQRHVVETLDKVGWLPEKSEIGAAYWIRKGDWGKCNDLGILAVEPLVLALKHSKNDSKRYIAETLGKIGDKRAIEPLSTVLKDDSWGVQYAAMCALSKMEDVGSNKAFTTAINTYGCKFIAAAQENIDTVNIVDLLHLIVDYGNNEVKLVAIEAIGKSGDARAIEWLPNLLNENDNTIQNAIVEALDKLGWIPGDSEEGAAYWVAKKDWKKCIKIGTNAIDPLNRLLRTSDSPVRSDVINTLHAIGGSRVFNLFLLTLKNGDSELKSFVAKKLGEIGDINAVNPLILALKGDIRVKCSVASALGKIGDTTAVNPLILLTKHEDPGVRCVAAWALGDIGGPGVIQPIIDLLKDNDRYVRQAAIGSLGKINDIRSVEALINELTQSGSLMPIDSLVQIGDLAVDPLISLLNDSDHGVRRSVVEALGKLGAKGNSCVVDALKNAMNEEHNSVVVAMARINKDYDLEKITTVLKDEDWYVRMDAVNLIGEMHDSNALQLLDFAAQDVDPYIRDHVVDCLIDFGDDRAAIPLTNALVNVFKERYSFEVRKSSARKIVEALDSYKWKPKKDEIGAYYWMAKKDWNECKKIGNLAINPLLAALGLVDVGNNYEPAEVLDALNWQPGQDEASANYWVAKHGWRECEKIGSLAVGSLIAAISCRSAHWTVRSNAALVLGEIGDRRAVDALIDVLKKYRRDIEEIAAYNGMLSDAQAAAKALGKIGDPQAVEPLIAALKYDGIRMRRVVVEALGLIGDARAVEPLRTALKDANIHDTVVVALNKLGFAS